MCRLLQAGMILWLGFCLPVSLWPQSAGVQRRGNSSAVEHASGMAEPLLTKVQQVRQLSQQQSARSVPVRLTGVVTALSGYKNSFFVQDATGGISVDRTDRAEVHVGDRVVVTGVSNAGLFAPLVLASQVDVAGRAPLPEPRRVSYADMSRGAQDSQWVEMQGVVHSARPGKLFGHDVVNLILNLGGGSVKAILLDFAGIDYASLIDSTVRIRGVCSTEFNAKRQFVGLGLFVPDRANMDVVQAAPTDPFSGPATPIRNLLQFGQSPHRVKVTGIATYQIPGRGIYLQDGNDGTLIQTISDVVVKPGSVVEAVGFPVMGEYAPIIEDGVLRVTGSAPPVVPARIDAKDVIAEHTDFNQTAHDQQLVQLQGKVVESHIQGGQRIWTMRQDNALFEAYLPLSMTSEAVKDIGNGSVLLLSGICTVHVDSDHTPVSFSMLVRSADDVIVLKHASWWTTVHTLLVIAGLAASIVMAILWVVVLRHRVEQQTRIIRESEARFRELAEHDVLTGLPNRLMLEERIAQCLARCKAENLRAAIFTIDIDRFKQINDTHGHLTGDECLKIVAGRLQGMVRHVDTIARTGGEEFTIVVGGLTNVENAKRVSSAILDLFHEPLVLPDIEIRMTVSVGGALYPDDGIDSETLRRRSDQALYEAKRTGGNRAMFATEELYESIELTTAIENALREGLRSNSFALYFQPIVDATGAIRRFEALLRTTDVRLRELGPAQFIPVAEECGLIIPLGRWVMEAACRQIAEWQSLGDFKCPIAVNISGRQLSHPGFAEQVVQTLKQFQIAPGLLELELTETTVMAQLASVADTVAHLAHAGLAFAIDDFGTGYSSLSRLHELPIKTIKIDRSFVLLLEKNGGSHTIIMAIIQMAKNLGLEVVAEGVETSEQFQLLRELGCDYFQGYLFSRPLPADRVIEILKENQTGLLTAAS